MTIEYLLTSLIVILLPGTGVIYTLALGLGRGLGGSIWAALGCTLGIVPHMAASILGLAALLHASALAFDIVRYAGVAWLLYMAWGMWQGAGAGAGAMQVAANTTPASNARIVRDGFLINILNPKLSLFFLAFLPQFVTPGIIGAPLHMAILGLIFMGMTFIVFVLYGGFAAALRRHIVTRPAVMRWIGRGFAGAFALLGAKLALARI
ncbi:MAG: LysE family translocator [Pseudomonadota bacterium]